MTGPDPGGSYQPRLTVPYVPGVLDTGFWRASQPFDGQRDDPGSDEAATAVWVQPYQLPARHGLAAELTVDRTDIRVALTADATRQLAAQMLDAIGDTDLAKIVRALALRPRSAPLTPEDQALDLLDLADEVLSAAGGTCSQCLLPIADVHRDHRMDCTRRGQPGDFRAGQ